jgi:hypothetical protein
MFQKLSCERFCVRLGTLGDADVTTLGSNGVLRAVFALIGLCELV